MIPWVCYGHSGTGFIGGSLNSWPSSWSGNIKTQPLVWENGGHGEAFLMYPGPTGPIPSVRSERLRDALEDYEYLLALEKVSGKKGKQAKDSVQFTQRILYPAQPSLDDLDQYAARNAKLHSRTRTLLKGNSFVR